MPDDSLLAPHLDLQTGEVLETLVSLATGSCDGVLMDPPQGLGVAPWDAHLPGVALWRQVARILKPGAWVLAFGARRTGHRMASGMEEGGLEIYDQIAWAYGTGVVTGRRLRPAWEPVVMARLPDSGGGLAIERCRTRGPVLAADRRTSPRGQRTPWGGAAPPRGGERHHPIGRWPSNLILAHSPRCRERRCATDCVARLVDDQGRGASRFFRLLYCPKPAGEERERFRSVTQKPAALTTYLAALIRQGTGGRLLVPYCGTGAELVGGLRAGWTELIGIDADTQAVEIARERLDEEVRSGRGRAVG